MSFKYLLCYAALESGQKVFITIVEGPSSSQSQQRTSEKIEHLPNLRTTLPQLRFYSKFGVSVIQTPYHSADIFD